MTDQFPSVLIFSCSVFALVVRVGMIGFRLLLIIVFSNDLFCFVFCTARQFMETIHLVEFPLVLKRGQLLELSIAFLQTKRF